METNIQNIVDKIWVVKRNLKDFYEKLSPHERLFFQAWSRKSQNIKQKTGKYPPDYYKFLKDLETLIHHPDQIFEDKKFDPQKYLSFDEREEIAEKLRTHSSESSGRRFERCQKDAFILGCQEESKSDETAREFAVPFKCELRICPVCNYYFYKKQYKKFIQIVEKGPITQQNRLMLLTLTIKKGDLYRYGIQKLMKHVRELINASYPKKSGCGAIGVLEIGPSKNIHCHLLVLGPYISQKTLSRKWLSITGDSFIVDIRQTIKQAKNGKTIILPLTETRGLSYVLKYIQKVPRFYEPIEYADYLNALKRIRRIHTFGIYYQHKKDSETQDLKPPIPTNICPYCGSKLYLISIAYNEMALKNRRQTLSEARREVERNKGDPRKKELIANIEKVFGECQVLWGAKEE